MTSTNNNGFRLNMMTITYIGIAFFLLFVLHSIKSIYVLNHLLFWAYVIIIIATIFVSTYFFQRLSFTRSLFVVLVSTLIVGLMPYHNEIPRIFDLLTQPSAEVSDFAKSFSRPISITVDILFYILPTMLLFFLLALGIRSVSLFSA